MRDTEAEEGAHSTAKDPRRPLRRRFFGSLVLFGLLLGLMLGRLTAPGPVQLLEVAERPWGLVLWLDRELEPQVERHAGTYALRLPARGEAARGQLRLAEDRLVNWRLQPEGQALLLGFVAARPLEGQWQGVEEAGRWRLEVRLATP